MAHHDLRPRRRVVAKAAPLPAELPVAALTTMFGLAAVLTALIFTLV